MVAFRKCNILPEDTAQEIYLLRTVICFPFTSGCAIMKGQAVYKFYENSKTDNTKNTDNGDDAITEVEYTL